MTRAETLTDNLKACIDRLTAMEVRINGGLKAQEQL